MSLEGRVAIVTGGGRGIGRAICLGLGADGAQVAVNFRKDEEAAQRTVADVEALGERLWRIRGQWRPSTNVVPWSIRWWPNSGTSTSW